MPKPNSKPEERRSEASGAPLFDCPGVAPVQPTCAEPPPLPLGIAYLLALSPSDQARFLKDKSADKKAADEEAQKAIDAENEAADLRKEGADLWGQAEDAWEAAQALEPGSIGRLAKERQATNLERRASAKDRQAADKEAEAAAHRRREADLRKRVADP